MNNYENDGERSPFLSGQKPVSLSPSWEDQKLSNDDLNFKDLTKAQITRKSPRDKWKLVFFIFLLHGFGTLMPWNMFITAKSYFVEFKLDASGTNSTTISNYAENFMPYIGFASQIPNLIFNWLNIFVNLSGDLTKRIVYSILVEIFIFIITVVLAMLDSSNWSEIFFWMTIISVVILNTANGIYQNTIYGMVATLPIKYTGAVVLGSNISGCFAAIISIFSSYMFSSKRTAAIYYFITAMLVLLICFDTYFALPLNNFFRYNQKITELNGEKVKSVSKKKVPYWTIFKQASMQLYNIFFTFFITLALFPAIYSDIQRVNDDFFISSELFTSITCFLTFNICAMLGSLVTSWIQWPKPQYLSIPVTLRIIFLPLFLFCNYQPRGITRILPVLISNEWIYWITAIVMSFSSGYLSSLGMMYAPQAVAPNHQITAGMFAAAVLITGICSGILFSLIFKYAVVLNITI